MNSSNVRRDLRLKLKDTCAFGLPLFVRLLEGANAYKKQNICSLGALKRASSVKFLPGLLVILDGCTN